MAVWGEGKDPQTSLAALYPSNAHTNAPQMSRYSVALHSAWHGKTAVQHRSVAILCAVCGKVCEETIKLATQTSM